ncbi:hypothetical protein MCEMRE185_01059 [Candidatus Nanopelagicaceae bacterium]
MLGVLFLSSLRFASLGLRYSLLSLIAGVNVVYVLILLARGSISGGIDRSNFSFILVVLILYIGPNLVGLAGGEGEHEFEKWVVISLIMFLAIYTVGCFINNELFWKIAPPAGLITPQLTAAIFLGIKTRNRMLLILAVTTFLGIAKNHYQSSYILAPVCVVIVLLGNKSKLVRNLTMLFLAVYSILVVLTDLLVWLLSVSSSEGYDNVIIRVAFVEYGINFVRENPIFGGALTYPVTILIKNAGYFTTLPLHSDALTWLIGAGAVGWFLYSLTIFTYIKKCWTSTEGHLQNSIAAVLLCNYLTGFFNSQYSTFAFLFTCFYTVAMSFSVSNSRKFENDIPKGFFG